MVHVDRFRSAMSQTPRKLDHVLVSRLRLRHLALVARIAHHRTLSRVAAEMQIGQPAVTKALKEVEDIFMAQLFERTQRGLVPTATGEVVVHYAVAMLEGASATAQQLTAIGAGMQGRVRLGVIPHVPDVLLAAAMSSMLTQQPPMTLLIREALTDDLVVALGDHELDCAIGRSMDPGHDENVVQEPIFQQEPRLVVSSQAYERVASRRLDWALLAQMDWIMLPPRASVRRSVNAIFSGAGLQPPVPIVETYSLKAAEAAFRVLPSAITIMPVDMAQRVASTGACRIVPHALEWKLPPICMLLPKAVTQGPALLAMVAAIRKAAAELAQAEQLQAGEL